MRKIADSGKTECSIAFELVGRGEVAAERLLDDDAGVLAQPDFAEALDDGREQARRNGQVVGRAARAAERRAASRRSSASR